MKAREMFKKVEEYNEIARLIGSAEMEIGMELDFFHEHFSSYEQFKKYIKSELIDEVGDAILSYKDFEFGCSVDFPYEDGWSGREYKTNVYFGIYSK